MIAPPKPPTSDELEALIKEARERQLRRRLVGVAVVVVAAAAALGIHSVLTSSGKTAAVNTGHSIPLAPSICRMANLTVKEIPISNPTGLDRIGLQFVNQASTCRLDGYPVLRFSDAKGVIPFRFRYLGTPHTVTVPEHHSTFSIFSKFRCDIGITRSTIKTTVGLPNQWQGLAVLTGGLGGPSICQPGIPAEGRWVTVTPLQSLRAAYRVSLIGNGTGPGQ